MKCLYIDCAMGAAGDMLTGALLELVPEGFVERLNAIGIPGVVYSAQKREKLGAVGTHVTVKIHGQQEGEHAHHGHHHAHSTLHTMEHIFAHLNLPDQVRQDALGVYRKIAEAESHAHGVPVEQVHFHEVGALDAVADVAAVCLLMDAIGAERIVASAVHVGSGTVHCAHGELPVPAPATAYLLRDVPTYGGEIRGELCTPTGAALLTHFASEFGDMPPMSVTHTGIGVGNKDFLRPNCVRALLGVTE